jgi:integrase
MRIARNTEVPGPGGTSMKLEQKALASIIREDIEAVCELRRQEAAKRAAKGAGFDKSGEVGVNRMKARLRHFFNWAIAEDYIDRTPFKREGVTRIKLSRAAETARSRRLIGDEEQRLLAATEGTWLYALIVAALETGCRRGELLSLQWRHVDLLRNAVTLIGARTKTSMTRSIPITTRLRAVLDMKRHGPDGQELGLDAYVFGNEVGEQRHDIKIEWKAALKSAKITGLRFHDLRREFGSRLIETPGVHPAIVRDWLGHASITTTSRYLATSAAGLLDAARRFEVSRLSFAQRSHIETTDNDRPEPAEVL